MNRAASILLLIAGIAISASAEQRCVVSVYVTQDVKQITSYARAQNLLFGVTDRSVLMKIRPHTLNPGNQSEWSSGSGIATSGLFVQPYAFATTYTGAATCFAEQMFIEFWDGSASASATSPPPPQDPPPPPGADDQNHGAGEPLILDLKGDGILTTRLEVSPVQFDISGDGMLDTTAWTDADSEDALLYFDLNHNQSIDGGIELFGDATIPIGAAKPRNGFEALAEYDDALLGGNGDGVISPSDRVWGMIRLWVDRDHDGRMTRSEDYSLASRGIVELSLSFLVLGPEESYGEDASGNWHMLQGTFRRRGVGSDTITGQMHDVYFRFTSGR